MYTIISPSEDTEDGIVTFLINKYHNIPQFNTNTQNISENPCPEKCIQLTLHFNLQMIIFPLNSHLILENLVCQYPIINYTFLKVRLLQHNGK